MRTLMKASYLGIPIAMVALAAALPLPLPWSLGGMVLGLLLFQLALVGGFDNYLPEKRRYLALRSETERLLALVRDLNAAILDARAIGVPEERYTEPIMNEMRAVLEALPAVAGVDATVQRQASQPSSFGQNTVH